TAFDPPSLWDGSCVAPPTPVPANQDCGGQPCVQSLTIAPLTVNETGCAPVQDPVPADAPATWGTFARACKAASFDKCNDQHGLCVPVAPGFKRCAFHEGDVPCPTAQMGPYVEKYTFYGAVDDTRSCTPCTCGAPLLSECSAEISVYEDAACMS